MISKALEQIILDTCNCNPATDQLIRRGLFPSSPSRPSIAADFRLLELITTSFLHLALNITGWADLLEEFWEKNGFRLKHKVHIFFDIFNGQRLLPSS
jgi:CxC2 like cysteine cluster associated with KDZ transposases